jgi:septal ring factor EnvC (AmiA/AmiB activator)
VNSTTSAEDNDRERRNAEAKEIFAEIERQKAASEELRAAAEQLDKKIRDVEQTLADKRKLADALAQEMRELNLQSLSSMPVPVVSPVEASRSPTEGELKFLKSRISPEWQKEKRSVR